MLRVRPFCPVDVGSVLKEGDHVLWLMSNYTDDSGDVIVNVEQFNTCLKIVQCNDYARDKQKCLASKASDYTREWVWLGNVEDVVSPGVFDDDKRQRIRVVLHTPRHCIIRTPLKGLDFEAYQLFVGVEAEWLPCYPETSIKSYDQ